MAGFAPRYFPPRFYAPRYWPIGAAPTPGVPQGFEAVSEGIAVELAVKLASVVDVGQVHIGERHIRDDWTLKSLFASPVDGQRDRLLGWQVTRDAANEEWYSTSQTRGFDRYVLRGVQGLSAAHGSERSFQELVEAVWAQFRSLKRVAGVEGITATDTPTVEHRIFQGRLCHYAEIAIIVEDLYDIPDIDPELPQHKRSVANARGTYGDISGQLTLYLSDLADAGQVHDERRYIVTREDSLNLLTVPTVDGPDGSRHIRSWQVFRDSDDENRGIGQRIDAESVWRLQCAWSWIDSQGSGTEFQAHLDTVRERFRALSNLGNPTNYTMSVSSPLQITEIGARQLAPTGALVHFADCEVRIQEVVHA